MDSKLKNNGLVRQKIITVWLHNHINTDV